MSKTDSFIYLPIANLRIIDNQRYLRKLIEHNDFIGFDTETYKGTCKLLADSFGRYIYNPTFEQCLDFLWYKASESYYRSFWNLDFDISAILKLWNDIEKIDDLIHGKEVIYENYRLSYLRPKFLSIKKGKKSLSFTDLFFMYKTSLENASVEFLNEHKIDTIDGNLLNTSLKYWIQNLDDIIKYCIQDCKLTADLGRFLIYKLREVKLPLPKFFSSYASLSKQYFRINARIPSVKYIPINIMDIAYHTYYGGRFEVLQKGYFDKLWYYDINSAYPSIIKDLPSLKYGTWYKVYEVPKKETIGFYKVFLDIPPSYISAYPLKYKTILFPHGVFENWITWYEADLLKDYIIKVHYGYEFEPASKEYYPFTEGIDYLFRKKAEQKNVNEVFYWLFKIVMNSLYGCFYERHSKPDKDYLESGVLFNPVYATVITAKTRYKLLNDVGKKDLKNVIAFHTDSVMSTKPLKKLKLDSNLGNWSLESNAEGVVIASGIYQIGKEVKKRGFSTPDINWFELLKEFSTELKVPLPRTKVIKIADSLKRWNNIDKVNTFVNEIMELDINSDKKRKWNRKFDNCKDLLENNVSSTTLGFRHFLEKELV